MVDLVKELRQASLNTEDYRWKAADKIESLLEYSQRATLDYLGQIGQLSDEIERLEEIIDQMRHAESEDHINLTKENVMLRAALRETLEIAMRNEDGDYIARARAALEDKP